MRCQTAGVLTLPAPVERIRLEPESDDPSHSGMEFGTDFADELRVIAEFVRVLQPTSPR